MDIPPDLNPRNRFLSQYTRKTKFIISLSVLGLTLFLSVSAVAPFKDQLFSRLYPKPKSQAQTTQPVQANKPEFKGYIVEFKDEPLAVYQQRVKQPGQPGLQPVPDYEKDVLLPNHEKAKQDILSRIPAGSSAAPASGSALVNQPQQNRILREYTNVFNGVALDVDEASANEIKKSPFVKNVYPNLIVKSQLAESVPLIKADKVWQLKDIQGRNITGEGINIAVLDSGVDYTHPDLGQTQITERSLQKITQVPLYYQELLQDDQILALNNNRLVYVGADKVSLNTIYLYSFTSKTTTEINLPQPDLRALRVAMDGDIIAYYAVGTNFRPGIYFYDLQTQVHKKIAESWAVLSISVSGRQISYVREQPFGSRDFSVYTYNVDSAIESAVSSVSQYYTLNPKISGNFLAYSVPVSGWICYDKMVIWDLQTKTNREIYSPDIGPIIDFKGSKILYSACNENEVRRDSSRRIYYLYDINTRQAQKLYYPDPVAPTGGVDNLQQKLDLGTYFIAYLGSKGGIGDDIIFFSKSLPSNTKMIGYDTKLDRYVRINVIKPAYSYAVEGKKACFLSLDYQIYCHDYEETNSYELPSNVFNNKIIDGYNFIDHDDNPLDDAGHGTHVAATVAGNGVFKGVAPSAKLVAYKVLNNWGSGLFSDIIAAIDKAVSTLLDSDSNNNIQVINMSIGAICWDGYTADCGPDDPLSRSVDNAVQAGITVVVAAGNEGPDAGTITTPGTAKQAITVGAVDKNKQLASFSSRGPVVYNGETINKPDIVAPGVSICAAEWDSWLWNKRCIDDKHISISGTSMATPHVAGVAALIKQAHPNWLPSQIKSAIQSTAENLGLSPNEQGSGLIDALASSLSITPSTTLSGRVTNSVTGAGIAGVVINQGYDIDPGPPACFVGIATTDANGNFSIPNIAVGTRFCLRAPKAGVSGYTLTSPAASSVGYECQAAGQNLGTVPCGNGTTTDLSVDNTYNFVYTPTLPKSWTIKAEPVCSNGATPMGQSQIGYVLWPPDPFNWSFGSFYSGIHSTTLSSYNSMNSVYLGLWTDTGEILQPVGIKPHPAIIYSQVFNPPTWTASWNRNDLPEGIYSIQFQAPSSWCPTPTPTATPAGVFCNSDAQCGMGQVCSGGSCVLAPTPTPRPTATPTATPTPTPTPTPTATPTPTPAPCTIASAAWVSSANPVVEGSNVYLNATTAGDCSGKALAWTIWEDDGLLGRDPVRINPAPAAVAITSGTIQTTWTAEYQQDGPAGLFGLPEYYFEVTVIGSSQMIRSADPKLQVTAVQPFTPVLSLNTTCSSVPYSDSEATVSWTNPVSGQPVSWVDISQDQSFTSFYHKNVTGQTSTFAPIGFNGFGGTIDGLALIAQPNTTYYVRLFNGSHSSTQTFNLNFCPAPTPTPTPSCPTVACDINGDGKEDFNDGNLVNGCWNKPAAGTCQKVDVQCDGVINIIDIQKFAYACPRIFPTPTPTPLPNKINIDTSIQIQDKIQL